MFMLQVGLIQKGAQSRTQLNILQQLRVSPSQKLSSYSHSLDTASGSTQALQDVFRSFGEECSDARCCFYLCWKR